RRSAETPGARSPCSALGHQILFTSDTFFGNDQPHKTLRSGYARRTAPTRNATPTGTNRLLPPSIGSSVKMARSKSTTRPSTRNLNAFHGPSPAIVSSGLASAHGRCFSDIQLASFTSGFLLFQLAKLSVCIEVPIGSTR